MDRLNLLGMHIDCTSYESAVSKIIEFQNQASGRYVCVANVHMCMEAYDNSGFREVVNSADMVVPDGRPLVWALRALGVGGAHASQVRGSDLLLRICKEAERHNIAIGLYGGTHDSLYDFTIFLKNKFPKLNIQIAISPPFRPLTLEEDNDITNEINISGCKILFVGIGCPKQENWMANHRDKLSCVMVGVGAAFDFFSGQKKHAPRWMQKVGLEWLFRLASEPRRLWKRYLKHNPRFVFYFLLQWVLNKKA